MTEKKKAGQDYYRLHTEAVEELVTASMENTPVYSREELERYTSAAKKKRLPVSLKTFLIKAWFYGAVCYFVFWGLGMYVPSQLDQCVIAAAAMGLVTDLLINPLLRFVERKSGESGRHMMVARTGVSGLLLNMVYALAVMFLVVTAYAVINALLSVLFAAGTTVLGVGPIGFGLIAACVDTLLIGCRRMLMDIAADARRGSAKGD
ncbi:MAG: hypothetical protein IKU34_01300 [Clostridia bacterium]|nr:hypothetical protein [Clostridia bacterium]